MRDTERDAILAELEDALWELESDRTGKRRVLCHPSAVHRFRYALTAFPDAHLIAVVGSNFIPIRHLYVEDLNWFRQAGEAA